MKDKRDVYFTINVSYQICDQFPVDWTEGKIEEYIESNYQDYVGQDYVGDCESVNVEIDDIEYVQGDDNSDEELDKIRESEYERGE